MKKSPILLVNEKHKLVYCQTPKAGTDSWCKLFLVLSGYKNYTDVLKMNVMNVSAAWKKHVPRLSQFSYSIKNIHWRNMHQICFPCDIKYDIIGRFEHIEDDSNYILRLVGSDIRFPKSTRTHFTNSSHHAKIKQSYATIPINQ
ncbi:carbohydrate sulfotransferase 11-like [Antedon mediterranea]|uniref:carbohydrate sulfotransferase 11-like n=1 Tax=Antedon mediterranea TaxID=105859 RepID=UPI003AF4560D